MNPEDFRVIPPGLTELLTEPSRMVVADVVLGQMADARIDSVQTDDPNDTVESMSLEYARFIAPHMVGAGLAGCEQHRCQGAMVVNDDDRGAAMAIGTVGYFHAPGLGGIRHFRLDKDTPGLVLPFAAFDDHAAVTATIAEWLRSEH